MSKPYIIAIDFDDTICKGGFPDIKNGKIIESTCHKMWQQIDKNPDTVFVLWTCRDDEVLKDAIGFIKENALPIFFFNENHPSTNEWLLGGKTKIFAHEYWDDRAVKI